jgi:signal peptidase I
MHPFIRPGDWVTILPASGEDRENFRPGVCVVFRDQGRRWLIHRVIGRGGGSRAILTKGDALLHPDYPVKREWLAGRVTVLERSGSGRTYLLDRPSSRRRGRVIALLSRWEAAVFSLGSRAGSASEGGILVRLVKSPRWLLTRIFFP